MRHGLLHQAPTRAGGRGHGTDTPGRRSIDHIDGAGLRLRLQENETPLGILAGKPLGDFVLWCNRIAEEGLAPSHERSPAHSLVPLDESLFSQFVPPSLI